MKRDSRLTELLHELTQSGYIISFSGDFDGMVTISYAIEDGALIKNSIPMHEHVGVPGMPADELYGAICNALESFQMEMVK